MEQPQYNLLNRTRVEDEYARLYEDIGLGLTTWSPLAGGILTGKYLDGVPEGSRATAKGHGHLAEESTKPETADRVCRVVDMARDLDVTPAQLSLAWLLKNPHVSTVITGASSVAQVKDNMGALTAKERLDDGLKAQLDEIFS